MCSCASAAECGRVKGKGETLIVDGKPVSSAVEYPWHVAVYDKKYRDGISQICGGTLITPKFFVSGTRYSQLQLQPQLQTAPVPQN